MSRSKRKTARLISQITGELATTAMDLVVLTAATAGGIFLYGPRGKDLCAGRKTEKAFKMAGLMYKKWDKSSFRRAVGRAVGEGLVKRVTDGFKLTEPGIRRLKDLLPEYKRPQRWDGKLWLVTYDIPDDKQRSRDRFRRWLFEIGCRMIQESVWLSLKNPGTWIKSDVRSHKKGGVIVSCLGKDGHIGEETLGELIYRVFELKKINQAYRQWLAAVEKFSGKDDKALSLGWRFLAILRQDPCLPVDLLPPAWPGGKARKTFESEIEPLMEGLPAYL